MNIFQLSQPREDLIIAEALAYAIGAIQTLPQERQCFSNMCDMCDLIRRYTPTGAALVLRNVRCQTGYLPDIFADFSDMTLEQQTSLTAYRTAVNATLEDLLALQGAAQ